jgi:hypothetical protein
VTNINANVRRQAIDLDVAVRLLPNGTDGQNVCAVRWRKKGAGSTVTCSVSHNTAVSYCTVLSSGHALRDLFLCFSFRKHETQLPERHKDNTCITKSHFARQFTLASSRLRLWLHCIRIWPIFYTAIHGRQRQNKHAFK